MLFGCCLSSEAWLVSVAFIARPSHHLFLLFAIREAQLDQICNPRALGSNNIGTGDGDQRDRQVVLEKLREEAGFWSEGWRKLSAVSWRHRLAVVKDMGLGRLGRYIAHRNSTCPDSEELEMRGALESNRHGKRG